VLGLRRAVAINGTVDVTLLMLNASQKDCEFIYPKPILDWSLKIDSANPDLSSYPETAEKVVVSAHGAVLLGASVKL
jgi:hypothetical protein